MTPPLISCIVPVFNGKRYLGEALESILQQSYRFDRVGQFNSELRQGEDTESKSEK